MASLPPLTASRVLRAVAGAVDAVWPFVLAFVLAVPLCGGGVLLLGAATVDYGPIVGMQVAAIAAEAVVIIPAHVWLGCWLCGRISADSYRADTRAPSSSSPARHRKVA